MIIEVFSNLNDSMILQFYDSVWIYIVLSLLPPGLFTCFT